MKETRRFILFAVLVMLMSLSGIIIHAQSTQPQPDAAGLLPEFNRWRTAIGIRPYQEDVRLSTSAQFHSDDMVARDFFSHDAPSPIACNGEMVITQAQRAACFGTYARGEGLTFGAQNADEATRSWLSSYGHCTGVMNPSATHLGGGGNDIRWTFQFNGNKQPETPVDHESFCRCTSSGEATEAAVQACVEQHNAQFNGGATPPVPPPAALQRNERFPATGTYNNTSGGGIGIGGEFLDGTLTIRVVPVNGNPSGVLLELADSDFNKFPGETGTDSLTYTITDPAEFGFWFDASSVAQGDTFYIEVHWEAGWTTPAATDTTDTAATTGDQTGCSQGGTNEDSMLNITNNTLEPLTLIWRDFECTEQDYGIIEAGQTRQQGTFDGHEWRIYNQMGDVVEYFIASAGNNDIVIGSAAPASSSAGCLLTVNNVQEMIGAINQANDEAQCPGPDVITMLNDLEPTASHDDGDTAFPTITTAIIIDGTQPQSDGINYKITRPADAPEFRFFTVDGKGDNQGNLTLRNMEMYGGRAESGGAVFVDTSGGGSAALAVDNVFFMQNYADGNGGAIMTFSMGGGQVDLNITSGIFVDNEGSYGGAIYSGGFDNGDATANLANISFNGNTARIEGGAVYNNGLGADGSAIMTIENGTFSSNGSDGAAGAIANNGRAGGNAQLTMTSVSFSENFAATAGDTILNLGQNGNATTTWDGQTVGGAENVCFGDDSGALEVIACQ